MHAHRFLRHFAVAATLGAVVVAGTMSSATAETRVKLGTVAWIGYAPFYIAAERDLFAKHSVKVELQDFPDPALMPAAIAGGGLQGAMYTYDQVITSVGKGQKHRVVMPIDYSNGADAIIADKSIKSIADLKGKKVAYPFSTCDNLLVVFALEKAGMEESDIQGIDTTPETVAAALTGGTVAGATYEPNITQILKLGGGSRYKVLYTSKSAPGLITDVLYFDEAFIAKNRKAVEGVIAGYLDGLAFLKAKPEEARRIVAKYMSVTAAEVKEQQAVPQPASRWHQGDHCPCGRLAPPRYDRNPEPFRRVAEVVRTVPGMKEPIGVPVCVAIGIPFDRWPSDRVTNRRAWQNAPRWK